MSIYTRQDYMAEYSGMDEAERKAAHRRYFAQFVSNHTISLVVCTIGAEALRKSTDPHMNDIPLASWDELRDWLPLAMPMKAAGDYYTLGNAVCIAKEAARQWLEAQGTAEGGGA